MLDRRPARVTGRQVPPRHLRWGSGSGVTFFPEMITRQDGAEKNDCERNAARRFFEALRREHPHLKLIVTEDALSSNAPHIEDLQRLNLRFILGVKPGDHQFLFAWVDEAIAHGKVTELQQVDADDPDKLHFFRFVNQAPLNGSRQDLLVNFLEYWQVDKNNRVTRFSWVTDLTITPENAWEIMRCGCLLYTSPSPRDGLLSRMPSSA